MSAEDKLHIAWLNDVALSVFPLFLTRYDNSNPDQAYSESAEQAFAAAKAFVAQSDKLLIQAIAKDAEDQLKAEAAAKAAKKPKAEEAAK